MASNAPPSLPKVQFNACFSAELIDKLDAYAEMVGQSKAQIAAADRDEFASAQEVEALLKKYGA